ncbi:MAG: ornithine cyclodeaminase family protein [Sulfitobacter sp.]|jgi:L-arginine dehydrogenase|uniref:NAD(P)H-dependent anabolic L-arginine dehydrogenase DauB n=1 Tax=Sulfitobacter pacificus TaxID=1499314 RepID=A0ABQ5VPB1_9RHOB|nr:MULTISPECIES: ornithine cyclodeaminase family protein [Sulfitobacter]QFT57686.1 ornithine cyclodeaminase [Sulfitobacter sp. THAF37]WOI13450.1 ornithine cyclodeaminase family protein [Sulfitobacter sp. LC.270.F.C4]WPZ27449.1 ornithine cyclodeaminase family protein [Sulfitobacter pontiacus]GLQ29035.1 NAD(P)H-dependent anabolic L-arginine dehydrogenase DauB [Sulfitobacter pacificus]
MANTPITLDRETVSNALGKIDIVEAMRDLFTELGQDRAVQPPQTITEFPQGGDFITYLGALGGAGVFGAKLSPYLPRDGGPIITAWSVLMSMETGQPLALLDAGALTTERTAATTALAVDLLAPNDRPLKLAVIGSGAVAQAHMRHVAGLRDWADVRVYSPSLASVPETQAKWQGLQSGITLADTAKVAVQEADVVMLCTSSGTPVVDVADFASNALVTSISTNVARAHEVDPAFLKTAQVYCDYRATTPNAAGDMVIAQESGWSANDICGDLAELCVASCAKPDADRPVFFRSIGLGLEDIAIGYAVYQHATA